MPAFRIFKQYDDIAFSIHTDVYVVYNNTRRRYKALWDTGANFSAVSSIVVDDLKLKPDGKTKDGKDYYTVGTELIWKELLYSFSDVYVVERLINTADVLIGMNIIANGDFILSTTGGKTTFVFEIPPQLNL